MSLFFFVFSLSPLLDVLLYLDLFDEVHHALFGIKLRGDDSALAYSYLPCTAYNVPSRWHGTWVDECRVTINVVINSMSERETQKGHCVERAAAAQGARKDRSRTLASPRSDPKANRQLLVHTSPSGPASFLHSNAGTMRPAVATPDDAWYLVRGGGPTLPKQCRGGTG